MINAANRIRKRNKNAEGGKRGILLCRMVVEGLLGKVTFGRRPRRMGKGEPCQCLLSWWRELSQGCVASLRTGKEASVVGPD